ncbi:MAG: FecR domain-containing protein [Bdellovibrionia bacterium]
MLKVLGGLSIILFSLGSWASSVSGVFMVVKGSVSVKNSSGTNAVKVGHKVNEGDTIITAADSRARIVMQDRNVINLNPDSELKIEKYKNDGANKNVELNLLKGKTRNNVEQSYDGEKNKFLIKTPTAVAGVRGTQYVASFDVLTQSANFTVLRGSIDVRPTTNMNGPAARLGAGETVKVEKNTNNLKPEKLPKSELQNIDADTMASGGNKNSGPQRDVANVEASGSGSNEAPKSDSTNTTGGTSAETAKTPATQAGGEGNAPPKGEPKQPTRMVSAEDRSIKNANSIQDPVARATSPMPMGPPPMPIGNQQPVAPPPEIKEIIRNVNGVGTIIVNPVPQ